MNGRLFLCTAVKYIIPFLIYLNFITSAFGQVKSIDENGFNELKFVAQNKLLNQFIKRFNGEETARGLRLYPEDEDYHSPRIRNRSFDMLFDYSIVDKVKLSNFSKMKVVACNVDTPFYMNLHKGKIISELKVEVYYKSEIKEMTLFLKLQEESIGSKWVIFQVDFPEYDKEFQFDHEQSTFFLHPLSHEVGFITLSRAFQQKKYVELLVDKSIHQVDHLSLFLSHIHDGNMELSSIGELQYHIFQVPGFYMNVKYINRNNHNVGWLINDIVSGTNEEMNTLQDFILQR